jgi:two-component system, chemotaxis family, protein-glutamate methylesterase/glutaminase
MTTFANPKDPTCVLPTIKVLVVDDSAFMRYAISHHLEGHPQIQVVGAARNGIEALDLIQKLNPDVITMDIEMPQMDGITALREIMKQFPRPVIMLSSETQEGSELTITSLTIGAVDFVAKPAQSVNINEVMDDVTEKIISAASIKIKPASGLVKEGISQVGKKPKSLVRPLGHDDPIVLIGASTGGPKALNVVFSSIPSDFPAATVIVQHMPNGFTHSLAERLNSQSSLLVQEAREGDRLEIGKALLAPGGFHMVFNSRGQVSLNQNPTVHGVRPAVDVTLTSLVQCFGKRVTVAILTGMGNDGINGATLLHGLGGTVIAEHESSCVVYGMPRSVVEAGLADTVVPIEDVARTIYRQVK